MSSSSRSGLTLALDRRLLPEQNVLLGCAPSGGLYHKLVSQADVVKMINRAVRYYGIQAIDTAPWYGCGRSEQDLGAAFQSDASLATTHRSYVITKVGRVVRPRSKCSKGDTRVAWGDTCYTVNDSDADVCVHDYTKEGILASYAGSVERLGPKTPIHTMRLHDCETDERLREFFDQGGLEAFLSLKSEGKVQRLSLGMNEPLYILKILERCPPNTFDDLMMAGAWNLVDTRGYEVLQKCQELNIPVHIAGAFGAGLLWGSANYKYRKASSDVLAERDAWEGIAKKHDVKLPSLALRFAFAPAAVSHVAIGCASVKELDGCMDAAHHMPTAGQFTSIMKEAVDQGLFPKGLLAFDSTTPHQSKL